MSCILGVSDVRKSFGGNHVLAGVSFSLQEGEIVALLGPNGAGKTTLLNLISGQYPVNGGAITLCDKDVTHCAPSHPMRYMMMRSYQDAGVFPRLSALDNVVVPAVARNVPRRRARAAAREALSQVALTPVATETADHLSGGQRKLVDFARTLAVRPKLALLDEPTAGVHPSLADRMADLIREESARGASWLIVTHELPWAFSLCSRVIFLARGTVLLDGTPEQVRDDPRVREAFLT